MFASSGIMLLVALDQLKAVKVCSYKITDQRASLTCY